MGTPDFAEVSLKKLIDEQFDIAGVFCQPDKASGRGMQISFCPVKKLALENNIPVFQPEKVRDVSVIKQIQELNPDIIVVVAYGKIIPDDILSIPQYGCINVHGSLLPKYRGAAPIQWAVLNGDSSTGVTTMYLAHDMDTGDIIYSEETEIGEYETSGELFDRLAVMGADLLIKTLNDIENGTAPRIPQDDSSATYVTMLDKSICPIDFNNSSNSVIKHICGLLPWPVATTDITGDVLKVFKAEYTSNHTDKEPGCIVCADSKGIEVACKDNSTVLITEVQASGKKRMSAADYLRGHRIDG